MSVLSELQELEHILDHLPSDARVRSEYVVEVDEHKLPIYSIVFGPTSPDAPVVAFFGGVHGLERIGTRVVNSFLRSICSALSWDNSLRHLIQHVRIAFYPIVNPGGMLLGRRSNPRGIDLMRNAPLDAEEPLKYFVPGGHRISPKLPWYRGESTAAMEPEAYALCQFVRREVMPSPYSLCLDVHSGFGFVDRVWFPYSHSRRPFPRLPEIFALNELLDRTLTNHIYRLEPQTSSYMMHGDLWDYLYLEHQREYAKNTFLPICLEMGSWAWVKKNPRQLLSILGLFNPILPHRTRRTLRRHLPFLDFLVRSTNSWRNWQPVENHQRELLRAKALAHWYAGKGL